MQRARAIGLLAFALLALAGAVVLCAWLRHTPSTIIGATGAIVSDRQRAIASAAAHVPLATFDSIPNPSGSYPGEVDVGLGVKPSINVQLAGVGSPFDALEKDAANDPGLTAWLGQWQEDVFAGQPVSAESQAELELILQKS